ncbi:hypothetical protein ABIC47_001433 [Leifsonia sp. 563]|uniref:hypothetical protein n=1 Tax=Leifsonia sp. 563 TaxID=3156412 RepID=UPI0033948AE0
MGEVKPEDLVAEAHTLASRHHSSLWIGLMRVLTARLEQFPVPAEVVPVREVAHRYWYGAGGDPAQLMAAKELAWSFLKKYPPGQDVSSREGRLVRVWLCVLEPNGDDEEISMTTEWFSAMLSDLPAE